MRVCDTGICRPAARWWQWLHFWRGKRGQAAAQGGEGVPGVRLHTWLCIPYIETDLVGSGERGGNVKCLVGSDGGTPQSPPLQQGQKRGADGSASYPTAYEETLGSWQWEHWERITAGSIMYPVCALYAGWYVLHAV